MVLIQHIKRLWLVVIVAGVCIIGAYLTFLSFPAGALKDNLWFRLREIAATRNSEPECKMADTDYKILQVNKSELSWKALEAKFPMLKPGGRFIPTGCRAGPKLAIIIPYRNREKHLKLFLQHMHPFLQLQKMDYTIYVIELDKNITFNKGVLMNAGFNEVSKSTDIPCYVFHDVDMLPLHTGISYKCVKDIMMHPARFVRQYKFSQFYVGYMGGVTIFHKETFKKVNGFSNIYWGWGGEDDDMKMRLEATHTPVAEPYQKSMRYDSWAHDREDELVNRIVFIKTATKRMYDDGINSVDYHILKFQRKPLFTWLLISTNRTDGSYGKLKQHHRKNARRESP